MAEETANNLTGKRVSTTFRGLLHFPKSIEPSLAKQVVYDGNGTASALILGGDTIGMDVSGPLSCSGNLSANGNVIIQGDIDLSNGGNVNDVNILSSGSSVSLRSLSTAEVGKLRIRETSSDYELIFGNPTVSEKNLFSIIVKNDTTSNFYIKNSYNDTDLNSPLWINRATGEVNIKSLRVSNIKSDPPPGTLPPPNQKTIYGDSNRNVLPVGMICMFPIMGIPEGWIPCDGKSHNKNTLPELFSVIGYNYSAIKTGDMFQVPDYRGLFVRGVDYKRSDEATRTFLDSDGARNLDGTIQNDSLQDHHHNLNTSSIYSTKNTPDNNKINSLAGDPDSSGGLYFNALDTINDQDYISGIRPAAGINISAENRPKNIVALYCIKW